MRDLTKGPITKSIIAFALPMLLGNVLQQLYNTVDAVIVGRTLGEVGLAAVGTSFPVMFLLISLIMGLGMGANVLISQFFGAKDNASLQRTVGTMYTALLVGGILLSLVGLAASAPVLRLMNTPPEVFPGAVSYLRVIFIGLVGMFGYNGVAALLRGVGDSKTPLYFLILSSFLNIGLDILFIVTFQMGVAGAAWATIASQFIAFLATAVYLNKKHPILKVSWKVLCFDRAIFKRIVAIGLPAGIQQVAMSLGLIALQSVVNSFGAVTAAAYTAGTRVDTYGIMPLMVLGAAFTTFVGQNYGANREDRIRRGLKSIMAASALISIFFFAVAWLFGESIVGLFNTNPEVIAQGVNFLRIQSSFYLVVAILHAFFGLFRGTGDTLVPMIIAVVSLWLIQVPAAVILSGYIGVAGVWWSRPLGWLVGVAAVLLYYRSNRWRRNLAPPLVREVEIG